MSTDYTIYIPFLFIAMGTAMQLVPRVQARLLQGQQLTELEQKLGFKQKSERLVLYFWNRSCVGCNTMTPQINQLQEEYPDSVYKYDVMAEEQLTAMLKIRGVPATILIEKGVVQKVHMGITSSKIMQKFLSGEK